MLLRYLLLNVDHITQPSPIAANRKIAFTCIFITSEIQNYYQSFYEPQPLFIVGFMQVRVRQRLFQHA